jgi:hypothetical protein
LFINVVDDQLFSEDADAREITIPFHVIETISAYEFVGDLEAFPRGDVRGDEKLLVLREGSGTFAV